MCLNAVQDNKAKRTGIIYGISKCHENEPVDDLLTNASAMYMAQGSCQCYTFLLNFRERLHVRGVTGNSTAGYHGILGSIYLLRFEQRW